MKLICIGDAMIDVIVKYQGDIQFNSDTSSNITILSGGAAANTSVWAATLGINTTFIGHVGDDLIGKSFIAELRNQSVHVANIEAIGFNTGTVVVLVDEHGERTMFPSRGANSLLSISDFSLTDFDALYLSGYSLLDEETSATALQILEKAKREERTTFLDPASTGLMKRYGREKLLKNIQGVDFLLLNEEEARFLSQSITVEDMLNFLISYAKCAVIKLGKDGAKAKVRQGAINSVRALPAHVIDTTGAGDAFAAGFIAGWLTTRDIEKALQSASDTAAKCVANIGARPSVNT
jgi:sugar/nucleoside kinase (ribokinase family)